MLSCIGGFKEVVMAILDWCGEHESVVIAIAGFLSSVAIAKITSGLDIKKAICMRRFEAYVKAIKQLSLKLNVYYNIQAAFESLKEPVLAVDVMKSKIAVLLATFQKLGEIEKEDSNITGVTLYTVLPPYDVKPLVKELAYFSSRLQYFSCLVNLSCSEDQWKQFESEFREDVKRIAPMVEKETNYLNALCEQLKDEISKDKMAKKLLRKS